MRRRLALAAVLALSACGGRPNGLQPESRDISPRYTAAVRQVFAEAFAPDVAMRALEEPAFDPERVVATRRTPTGWRLLTLRAGEQIWGWEARREMKARNLTPPGAPPLGDSDPLARRWLPSLASIPVARCERPLPARLGKALLAAWRRQIQAARPEGRGADVMLDGDAFHFAAAGGRTGPVQAMAWSPDPRLPAGRLVALTGRLADFCRTGDAAAVAPMMREATSL